MDIDGLTTVRSPHSPKETMDRLEAAVKTKGMTVFARVDHAAGRGRGRPHAAAHWAADLRQRASRYAPDASRADDGNRSAASRPWSGRTLRAILSLSSNEPRWLARRHGAAPAIDAPLGAMIGLSRRSLKRRFPDRGSNRSRNPGSPRTPLPGIVFALDEKPAFDPGDRVRVGTRGRSATTAASDLSARQARPGRGGDRAGAGRQRGRGLRPQCRLASATITASPFPMTEHLAGLCRLAARRPADRGVRKLAGEDLSDDARHEHDHDHDHDHPHAEIGDDGAARLLRHAWRRRSASC